MIANLDPRLVEVDDHGLDAGGPHVASRAAPAKDGKPLAPAPESTDKEVP